MVKIKKKNELADKEPVQKKRQIVTIDTYDRISRQLKITQILAILLTVAMLTFLCLYVYQLGAEKRAYRAVYHNAASRAVTLMNELAEDEFDYDTKYREITAELGVMCQMAYRLDAEDEQQKAVNELYYAYLKLPNQVKLHFEAVREQLTRIRDGDEEVYQSLRALVSAFDKQDY